MSCIRPCTGRIASCTRQCTGHVYGVFGRVHWLCTLPFSAVYIARTRPCNSPCTRSLDGRVQGSSGKCIRQVGQQGRAHVPRRHATAVCGPSRPCTRPVHSPFTPVYTAVYDGSYTAVRHVHMSTQQLKGRVRAMYTASTQSCTRQVGLHGRVHGPRRHVAAVGRVHGRNPPYTRSCTRPIHSRVHVRLHVHGLYAVTGSTRP